jgi:hypothetical protein
MPKKKTKLRCEVWNAEDMDYPTVGNYVREKDGTLLVTSADMGLIPSALCIIHELIECLWLKQAGVTIKQTVDWDMAHLDSDDPGSERGCPYGVGHKFAEAIERQIAAFLGQRWEDYDALCEKAFEIALKAHNARQRAKDDAKAKAGGYPKKCGYPMHRHLSKEQKSGDIDMFVSRPKMNMD